MTGRQARYISYAYYRDPRTRGLIVAPRHNSPGKHDATGAFHIGAREFQSVHGLAEPVFFDNSAAPAERRLDFLDTIRGAPGRLDVIAYFGHGSVNGLPSAKLYTRHLPDLADAIRAVTKSNAVILLYACSAGSFGGFASALSDQLNGGVCGPGNRRAVYGHTNSGHSFYNPRVTLFPDRAFVVEPGSSEWRPWVRKLRSTVLWAKFPFMTDGQLEAALATT